VRRAAVVLSSLILVLAGCGGGEDASPTAEAVEGTIPTETLAEGDSTAGKEVYASSGCGSCHTFEAAGSSAQVGPNLDESLEGKDAEYVRESIVNPDKELAEGFEAGIMPKNYGEQLSDEQLADLVAFLTPAS